MATRQAGGPTASGAVSQTGMACGQYRLSGIARGMASSVGFPLVPHMAQCAAITLPVTENPDSAVQRFTSNYTILLQVDFLSQEMLLEKKKFELEAS